MKHNKLYMTILLAIALSAFFAGYYCSQPAWRYVEVPMSVQKTQLALIDLGYKRVYVPEQGDYNDVTPDNKWGNITEASYNQYCYDISIEQTKGAK